VANEEVGWAIFDGQEHSTCKCAVPGVPLACFFFALLGAQIVILAVNLNDLFSQCFVGMDIFSGSLSGSEGKIML
jgi:hypothetical protein